MNQTQQGGSEPRTGTVSSGAPLLVLKKLDKRFGATHALKAVDLVFEAGEIHAIVGENGAGKSTLIKLLTGVHVRSSGEVLWEGQPVALATPHEAIDHGINAVHHFKLPAAAMLSDLTIGQQQLVATARASTRGTRFLIFDEPTGYLTRQEAAQLFALIRRLKAQGVTIVYISHRLEEVFQLADRVSILRDGQLVSTQRVSETNENALIAGMINRSIDQVHYKETIPFGVEILRTENLSGKGFDDVSVRVRAGEVIGLYGLIGAGRSEFVQSVFGRFPKTGGQIFWDGHPVEIRKEKDAIGLGIALVPESRRDQGLCLNLGVGFNINLPIYKRLTTGIVINPFAEKAAADKQIRDVQIKTASRDAPASSLSGGNQQKIVVGKWLNHGARLFIFDEPTVGVDVGTKVEIYKLFAKLLKEGAGIILISSYLPEVYDICDTLHVFRRGKLVSSHVGEKAAHETVLTEAIGV
jgi:ribose transport system ATP-binding protein